MKNIGITTRTLAFVLSIILAFSALCLPVNAAKAKTGDYVGVEVRINTKNGKSGSWSKYIVVDRTKANKDAKLTVVTNLSSYADSIDIQMLDKNSKVVWKQDKSITYSGKNTQASRRVYTLGKNVRYIQVRYNKNTQKSTGTGLVQFMYRVNIPSDNIKNVRIG